MNKLNKQEQVLLQNIKSAVTLEQQTTAKILKLICSVEKRALYVELGYSSLFQFLCKELKYSEAQAVRRINAARMLKEFPRLEKKISSGELNLTNLSKASQVFKKAKVSKEQRLETLAKIENQSTRQTESILFELAGEKVVPEEKQRKVAPDKTQVSFVIDNKLMVKIDLLKARKNRARHISTRELLEKLVDEEIARYKKQCAATTAPARSRSQTRLARGKLKEFVLKRAEYKCEHRGCEEAKKLEIDHIKPWILGGETSAENLRVLCQGHHKRRISELLN